MLVANNTSTDKGSVRMLRLFMRNSFSVVFVRRQCVTKEISILIWMAIHRVSHTAVVLVRRRFRVNLVLHSIPAPASYQALSVMCVTNLFAPQKHWNNTRSCMNPCHSLPASIVVWNSGTDRAEIDMQRKAAVLLLALLKRRSNLYLPLIWRNSVTNNCLCMTYASFLVTMCTHSRLPM